MNTKLPCKCGNIDVETLDVMFERTEEIMSNGICFLVKKRWLLEVEIELNHVTITDVKNNFEQVVRCYVKDDAELWQCITTSTHIHKSKILTEDGNQL